MSRAAGNRKAQLKPLFPFDPIVIGKVAIEGKPSVGDHVIDAMVQLLVLAAATGGARECLVELSQVADLDGDVELADVAGAKSEFAPGQPMAGDHLFFAANAPARPRRPAQRSDPIVLGRDHTRHDKCP